MFIECFGIPGAGKTTVTKILEDTLGASVVPIHVPKRYVFLFLLHNPVFSVRWMLLLVRACNSDNVWHLFRFKLSLFLNTAGRVHMAQQLDRKGKFVILDEGLVQRVFSLYETKQTSDVYQRIIAMLPISHTVLSVVYTGEIYTAGRVGTVRSKLGGDYKKQWQNIMKDNFQRMSEVITKQKFSVIHYSRDESDHQMQALIDTVQELL